MTAMAAAMMIYLGLTFDSFDAGQQHALMTLADELSALHLVVSLGTKDPSTNVCSQVPSPGFDQWHSPLSSTAWSGDKGNSTTTAVASKRVCLRRKAIFFALIINRYGVTGILLRESSGSVVFSETGRQVLAATAFSQVIDRGMKACLRIEKLFWRV